ncbi:MAG: sigma factor-like helix-turn-helix DNA-binding protein [Candidatus Paceibacterota bacterium]|jgi:hypothetical protein
MIQKILDTIVAQLPKRQKDIVSQRFGVCGTKQKTLAALGAKYGITRERVRQIESAAVKSIAVMAQREHALVDAFGKAYAHIETSGGTRRADILPKELSVILADSSVTPEYIELLFAAFKKPSFFAENKEMRALWYADAESLKRNKDVVKKFAQILRGKKEELIERGQFHKIFAQATRTHRVKDHVALNYLANAKQFAVNPFGDFGLSAWPEIVPKTIRDKSYLILKKEKTPMHFRDIAHAIDRASFDPKRAHPQTVHNELIKDRRFVLVGRGLYSLREFGIVPGTTREILRHILKKNGPLPLDAVVQLVGQQRVLKHNTIVLNLQNKKYFKRNQQGAYHIA